MLVELRIVEESYLYPCEQIKWHAPDTVQAQFDGAGILLEVRLRAKDEQINKFV